MVIEFLPELKPDAVFCPGLRMVNLPTRGSALSKEF
jgi:hypothetical protein